MQEAIDDLWEQRKAAAGQDVAQIEGDDDGADGDGDPEQKPHGIAAKQPRLRLACDRKLRA